MEDKLVTCSHCESELCYAIPLNETAWTYNCPGCGFYSNDIIKEGEYDVEAFEETMPELYKDIKYVDEEGKVWYPTVLQTEEGVVFVDGVSKENWGWGAIKNVPLTEEDKKIYVKDGKEVPPYKSDSKSLKHFGKFGFLEALNYINII
jgi:hypothetical protein